MLLNQLKRLSSDLTASERMSYKLLMSLAATTLSPGFIEDRALDKHDAYSIVSKVLVGLHTYGKPVTENGIAWKGRPDFVTDELLSNLQHEARRLRATATSYRDHTLGYNGEIANRLATSKEMVELVEAAVGPAIATGVASFIYYDQEGQGIPPHVDTDIFALNILMMLEHDFDHERRSDLVLFPPDGPKTGVHLQPGEIVIFYAGGVMHGRKPLHTNEKVTILTFGFQPQAVL
ncbi:hypothetical protein [Burkholderia vietnamiensis]|nr:hypothetical protein [Burkholderia vietnamiensis]